MTRPQLSLLLALAIALCAQVAQADSASRTLVLPFRSIGVSDTTTVVSRDLLIGSLQDLGVQIVGPASTEAPLPEGAEACDHPACAAALGRQHGASQVAYGSLGKLGDKIIARVSVVRVDEPAPYYRDQLTATTQEDLDRVMRRFAEGISTGRPNSDRASVESVTRQETLTPARRATRSGFGVRAGFLFPTGASFGGVKRLTNLHAAFKYELRDFLIESSPVLGFTWGDGDFDWSILDVSVSRIFGTRDFAPYLGLGAGVHSVTVEHRVTNYSTPYSYPYNFRQTETAPSADLVAGFMALRTYDFEVILEIRYHYIFEQFNKVDGNGANGVQVTIGTAR